jgi:hypothetical protein
MSRHVNTQGRECGPRNPRRLVWRFSCGFWTDNHDIAFGENKFGECPACKCQHWNQREAHQHGPVTSRVCDTTKKAGGR